MRLSLRTILFGMNLLFLTLPLLGIYGLRIYETALVQQTESELISQAAFVAAIYKNEITKTALKQHYSLATYGLPALNRPTENPNLTPIPAQLDVLKAPIYPPRPQPQATHQQLDLYAREAGLQMTPLLKDAQRITLSGLKVLDYQGLVVAGQERGLSFAHAEEFQYARSGQALSILRDRQIKHTAPLNSLSRNASINVFVSLPIVLDNRLIGVVWVNRTPPDFIQSLYNKRAELIWTAFILLSAMLIITMLLSYTITQPIRSVLQKTRLIIQEKPEALQATPKALAKEIAELSDGIDAMAHTIQHRTEYIRQFTAHVSHEFKTPLTSMQGSLELLHDHQDTMPPEQKQRFLNNMLGDVERLKLLVNQLLELAKADMAEVFHQKTALIPAIQDSIAYWNQNTFTVSLQHDFYNTSNETRTVMMTSESLHAIVSHLLQNSQQASATQVLITITTMERNAVIRIQDNGTGISEGNQQEIFTPFFTTRRNSGGTGLGLSIIRSLLERQGGSLELIKTSPAGTEFQLTLPLA